MKVLIVEDSAKTAIALRALLESQGHEVVWIVGVTAVNSDSLNAYDSIFSRCVPRLHVGGLDYSDCELILVDGNLDGALNGWELIPHFVKDGRHIVAISGAESCNELMRAAGADVGVLKADALKYTENFAAQVC